MWSRSLVGAFVLAAMAAGTTCAWAMQVTGYDPVRHDRFASGFPAAPVMNTDPAFVGLDFDWSGVGWDPADVRKGFGFVSPSHYLVARHFVGSPHVVVQQQDGSVVTSSREKVTATEYGVVFSGQTIGDLSLGKLQSGLPQIFRYAALDLNAGSTSNMPSAYNGRTVWVYGRGSNGSSPRIATTGFSGAKDDDLEHFFVTPRTDLQLEPGDSGSPAFLVWTDPNGHQELAIIGNHAAISDTANFHNFIGTHEVMGQVSGMMAEAGRALRVVGEWSHTWVGSTSNSIQLNSAWGIGGNPNASGATSDRFVLFDADSAANHAVSVAIDYTLRGIYLRGGVTAPAFSFGGSGVLSIERGGIANYAAARPVFSAPLRLFAHQFWDGGSGGLTVNHLDTNGFLLETRAGASGVELGSVTGAGALALESGQLTLQGNADYTGSTWVHSGELRVNGAISLSSGVSVHQMARLSGAGQLPAVHLAGIIVPDVDAQPLTIASLAPAAGAEFWFVFTQGSPIGELPEDHAGNAVLRLTDADPFIASLDAGMTIRVLLNGDTVAGDVSLLGGFFTDAGDEFIDAIADANWLFYVPDPEGGFVVDGQSYAPYAGNRQWQLTTQPYALPIGDTSINGRILRIELAAPTFTQLTYADWAATAFPEFVSPTEREPMADASGNGVVNLLAYAFGADPMSGDLTRLPVITKEEVEGVAQLRIRYLQRLAAADLVYEVEHSADLAVWQALTQVAEVIDTDVFGDGQFALMQQQVALTPEQPVGFLRLGVSFGSD